MLLPKLAPSVRVFRYSKTSQTKDNNKLLSRGLREDVTKGFKG